METIKLLILTAALIVLPGIADGAQKPTRTAVLPTTAINTACDASIHTVESPACASFELDMQGYTQVTLLIEYTNSTATAVQIYMDGSMDRDAPWAIIQAGDGGTVPQIQMGDQYLSWPKSPATLATTAWGVTFKDVNYPFVRWRLTTTGGAAGDTARVFVVRMGP